MCFNVSPTPSCQTLHPHAYICIDLHIIVLELSEAMQEPKPTSGSIEAHFSKESWFCTIQVLALGNEPCHIWTDFPLCTSPAGSFQTPAARLCIYDRGSRYTSGWRVLFRVCSCTSPWAGKSGGGIGIFKFLQFHMERVRTKKTRWRLSACCLIG